MRSRRPGGRSVALAGVRTPATPDGPRWLPPPWALWLLAACGPALLVAAAIGAVITGTAASPSWAVFAQNIYPNIVFGCLLPLLGALILTRLPRHPIGWLFLLCGLASALTLPVYGYARLALYDHPGQLPFGVAAAWLSAWLWTLGFMPLVTIGVLLFPDGRLPSPRWRALIVLDLVAVALAASATAFAPGPLENHHVADNPLGLPLPPRLFDLMGGLGFGLFLVGLVGACAASVVRWRRSREVERAQLTWFALAVALLVVGVLLPVPTVGNVVTLVAIPLLPVAVAVAILRHHLFGIDVVVQRSLVYAALTAVLLIAYAATVTALGAVLGDHADAAVALVATGLVAVAFAPLRDRLQRAADRLLYGDRGDPYAVLTGVGRRLGDAQVSGQDTLAEAAKTVAASLRLPYARVEVGDIHDAIAADWGTPTGGCTRCRCSTAAPRWAP